MCVCVCVCVYVCEMNPSFIMVVIIHILVFHPLGSIFIMRLRAMFPFGIPGILTEHPSLGELIPPQ